MNSSRVLVAGDVIDDILTTIEMPLRPDTDTPARIARSSGGSAANTAVWLAHLGVGVDFVGQVGLGDGQRFRAEFVEAGVDAHLNEVVDAPTGTIVVIVEGESRTMLTDRGANTSLDFSRIDQELLGGVSWVHLTGYSVFHHANPDAVTSFIHRALGAGAQVMVDASSSGFLEDFGVPRFLQIFHDISVLRCNLMEAEVLTGKHVPSEALEILGRLFPIVIITHGPDGIWWSEKGMSHLTEVPHPVSSIDPTGAGDAFNAGVLAGLVEGKPLEDSLIQGMAVASRCITSSGARP